MAKRANPALSQMWGTAATSHSSHLESQIAERDTEIEALKQQLQQLQQMSAQTAGIQHFPVEQLVPLQLPDNLTQPRKYFDPTSLEKLQQSIAKVGVQEPLLVRPGQRGQLEIISGERRWRASRELAITHLPAICQDLSDEDALEIALVANLMREDLNLVEETDSIIALIGLRLKVQRNQLSSLLVKIRNQRVRYDKSNQTIADELQQAADYSGIINAAAIAQIDAILKEFGITLDSFVSNRLSAMQKMPEHLLEAVRTGRIDFSKADVIRKAKLTQAMEQTLVEQTASAGLTKTALMAQVKALRSAADVAPVAASPDLPEVVYRNARKLRQQKVWSRIQQDARLRKKFEKLKALTEELLAAVE